MPDDNKTTTWNELCTLVTDKGASPNELTARTWVICKIVDEFKVTNEHLRAIRTGISEISFEIKSRL